MFYYYLYNKIEHVFLAFFFPITLFLFQKLERRKCSVSAIRMVNNHIIVQRSTHSLSFFKLTLKTLRGKENRWNRLNGRIIVRRLTRIFFYFFFKPYFYLDNLTLVSKKKKKKTRGTRDTEF